MSQSERYCINGFLVVRLPSMNRDLLGGRGAYSVHAPCLEDICYGGIDRMAWFDITEDLYNKTLPVNIEEVFTMIKEDNTDFTGIDLCKDLKTARMLLEYSNQAQESNELIAVHSEKLSTIKGVIDCKSCSISWLGYDIVSLGHWSLLSDGVFASPSSFSGWKDHLNCFGLLDSLVITTQYIQTYESASLLGETEVLPETPYGIEAIRIGRVG